MTSRDREILRWIGRLRMASAAQVSRRFGLGRAVGYARLSGLVRLGLLEHSRIFHATPGVYLATKRGLAAVDSALPPARVDVRTYKHDLELSTLVIELEREFGARQITTEREMRAFDTAGGRAPVAPPRFAVPSVGTRGQMQLTPVGHPRLHFPDCAVSLTEPEGGIIAIELEKTAKGRTRLRNILAAYVAARNVSAVRYYATSPRIAGLVEDEIVRRRAASLIEVRHTSSSPRQHQAIGA